MLNRHKFFRKRVNFIYAGMSHFWWTWITDKYDFCVNHNIFVPSIINLILKFFFILTLNICAISADFMSLDSFVPDWKNAVSIPIATFPAKISCYKNVKVLAGIMYFILIFFISYFIFILHISIKFHLYYIVSFRNNGNHN